MNLADVEKLANAILYEGYLLYPYRPSSTKNQQRWTFGVVYPRPYRGSRRSVDDSIMQTEALVQGRAGSRVEIKIRFLHVLEQTAGQDVLERELSLTCALSTLRERPQRRAFSVPASSVAGAGWNVDESATGARVRGENAIQGRIAVSAQRCDLDTFTVRVRIENTTPVDDRTRTQHHQLIPRSLVSTHTILSADDAQWVSLLEPPDRLRDAAASCENIRTWPVLVGDRHARTLMLSSPIILYDYPRLAPESPGDLFDATEIDELLSLRIRTLTDDEKAEAAADPRVRSLLRRTESLSRDELSKLHGVFRQEPTVEMDERNGRMECAADGAARLVPGARVRLMPRRRADAFDLILSGRIATVRSIEKDLDDNVFVSVTVDDDPGRDLGREGQVAHRFFFRPDELETLGRDEATR